MANLPASDLLAVGVVTAIQRGDVDALRHLLGDNPGLAQARIGEGLDDLARSLLHIATDWPGHFPNGVAVVRALVDGGADVNARFVGCRMQSAETPLHWAASSDDIDVLDALIAAGADIEAPGAIIGGGTPLADAVAFGQWNAARRLLERGAQTTLWQAAALGLVSRVAELLADARPPSSDDVTNAFWCACHGGQRATAELLLDRGADINWVGHDGLTPVEAAEREGADEVVSWLRGRE